MGVIHKLKTDVIEFILAEKQKDAQLSCRKLVPLVKKRFRINVSKSSINSVLSGLKPSSATSKQAEIVLDFAGAFFLKGADLKIGGSKELTEAVKPSIKHLPQNTIYAYNQLLIFMGLFGIKEPQDLARYKGSGLWPLVGLKYNNSLPPRIIDYYNSLCNKSLYYNVALRTVSLYTHITDFEPFFPGEESIMAELQALLLNIHKYAQKVFFPSIYKNLDFFQMRQQFYGLRGVLLSSKTNLIVRLSETRSLDVQIDIAHACKKLNDCEIETPSGQKLYIQPPI